MTRGKSRHGLAVWSTVLCLAAAGAMSPAGKRVLGGGYAVGTDNLGLDLHVTASAPVDEVSTGASGWEVARAAASCSTQTVSPCGRSAPQSDGDCRVARAAEQRSRALRDGCALPGACARRRRGRGESLQKI